MLIAVRNRLAGRSVRGVPPAVPRHRAELLTSGIALTSRTVVVDVNRIEVCISSQCWTCPVSIRCVASCSITFSRGPAL